MSVSINIGTNSGVMSGGTATVKRYVRASVGGVVACKHSVARIMRIA